jgi:adenylyl-sulfate kinase
MKGFTVWFTGLSGSGKTTISRKLQDNLREHGIMNVEILDGDVVRTNLSKGLGFSKEDRDINIRRIGFVCALLTRNGVPNMAAAISPYQAIRDEVREKIGNFVEVYVKCPMDELVKRDPKGLYKKALSGEIKNFTGVSDPYEEPSNPEVICDTEQETLKDSVDKIIMKLIELRYIEPKGDGYSEEEEEKIKDRLEALGYL